MSSVSPFDLVIFDCDGGLVDSEPLSCLAFEQVYADHGMKLPEGTVAKGIGMKQADIMKMIEDMTGHRLPEPTVMAITFVSYAFNLNMGTIVGAVGMRVRLYSRLGLAPGQITRVVGMSMLTNWLGYFLLAGLAFLLWPLALPDDWHLGRTALRALGAALVAPRVTAGRA